MRMIGRATLLIVCIYAIVAVIYSVSFLNTIENSARFIQQQQIPLVLSQNRNALKLERAASLIRSVYLAKDRRMERQIQLQLQTLCQSFTLDDNGALISGAREIAAKVKIIASSRETSRQLQFNTPLLPAPDRQGQIDISDAAATQAYQRAMQIAGELSENLATDAGVLADSVAMSVQNAAQDVKLGWILILTLPVLLLIAVLWVVKRHVMVPIISAIAGLESIGRRNNVPLRLTTPVFTELATIMAAVGSYDAISEDLKRTNEMLKVLSDRDALTGLSNRRTFEAKIQNMFSTDMEQGADLCMLMIDLDHFKTINDTYGHQAGDMCLMAVGELLQKLDLGQSAVMARYGGEEFVGVLPGRDLENAKTIAEHIRMSISELVVLISGQKIRLTTSIGISSVSGRNMSAVDLLAEADVALYQAKRNGRNRVVVNDLKNENRSAENKVA